MFAVRYATGQDEAFWFSLDEHLPKSEYEVKVRDKRAYVICAGNALAGVMRYNLFWDMIPFLTFIYMGSTFRGKGLGKQAMLHWENEMRALGHKMVMTSTQVDEQAGQSLTNPQETKESGIIAAKPKKESRCYEPKYGRNLQGRK